MIKLEKRLLALEQLNCPGPYPEGWPVLVPDDYTDEQIEAMKTEIGRSDIYRESAKGWAEMFIG